MRRRLDHMVRRPHPEHQRRAIGGLDQHHPVGLVEPALVGDAPARQRRPVGRADARRHAPIPETASTSPSSRGSALSLPNGPTIARNAARSTRRAVAPPMATENSD